MTSQICEVSDATINWNTSPLPVLTGSYAQQSTFDSWNIEIKSKAKNLLKRHEAENPVYTYDAHNNMAIVLLTGKIFPETCKM